MDALSDVPPWALSSMGISSLTLSFQQKQKLIIAAARRGCLQTLDWARSLQFYLKDLSLSDAAAAGGHLGVGFYVCAVDWLAGSDCCWEW